jgi:hypothetical protein
MAEIYLPRDILSPDEILARGCLYNFGSYVISPEKE